ncbi:MAG: hypothetical protein HUJ90_02225, partial [Bacteroidales bacterium]|nr:hypothetical protein [Bacteroidales bacterium]
LNGDIRNYDRWEFGSYKHYTPDEYAFGYLLQTGMQYETGFFAKTDIYNYIIDGWYKIGSMNRANIAVAGIPLKEQWNRTVERYTNKWAEEDSLKRPFTPMDTLVNKSDRYYHSYSSPLLLPNGNLLALYSSYAEATSLMEIYPDGNSKKLTHFGSNISKLDLLSEREIIWSEVIPDLRWSLKNSSILRSYNLDTGKFSNLTQDTRYYSPAVSHDKKMVAVVEYRVEGGSNAVLLNSSDFSIISAIPAADGGQIKEVAWLGPRLYATIIQDDGVGLYYLENGKWTNVVEPQGSLMVNLRGTDNLLYFRGDSDGTDNIYAYIPSADAEGGEGQFKRLTNSRFGAFTPYLDGDILYYLDYDITGYTPVKSRVDLSSPLSGDEWPLNPYNAYFDAEKGSQMAKSKVPMMSDAESRLLKAEIDTLQPEKFSKAADLIHFHSWAPIYMNPNRIMNLSFDEIYKSASLGVTALAQNLLGTATLIAGYSYHGGFHSGHINFNYSGLYPVLEFSADLNDRHRRIYSMPKSKTDTLRSPLLELSLRAYVPFNLGRSGINSVVTPFIEVDYKNDIFVGNTGREWHNFVFRYGVSYYRKLPVAHSAIIPRWGFGLSAQGYMMPTPFLPTGNKMESLWMLHLYGYLPGITPIQGIKLSATFQGHSPDESSMRLLSGNLASLPRGYKGIQLESYAKFSFDYAIPIYIGDFNITSITYFKRLKLIPFADYAFNSGEVKRMFSFGTALMVDARLLRLPEVSFGVRYARFMKPAGGWGNDFQFVVSTGL